MRSTNLIILTICLGLAGCNNDGQPDPDAAETSTAAGQRHLEKSVQAADQAFNSDRLADAQRILDRQIERNITDARLHELMAMVQMALAGDARRARQIDVASHHTQRATEQYEAAIAFQPNDPVLRQAAGELAHTLGDLDRALEHYEAALRVSPDEPKTLLYAAQIHLQRESWSQAESLLRRGLQLMPDEPCMIASLAAAASGRGHHTDARQHIQTARRIAPDDLSLRVMEARILTQAGEAAAAIELLAGLPSPQRREELVGGQIASAYESLSRWGRAAQIWQDVYEANPTAPRAWFAAAEAGRLALQAGDRAAAKMWLNRSRVSVGGESPAEVRRLAESLGESP